jgi:hypothetical protein
MTDNQFKKLIDAHNLMRDVIDYLDLSGNQKLKEKASKLKHSLFTEWEKEVKKRKKVSKK